jgi:hypothetical protein
VQIARGALPMQALERRRPAADLPPARCRSGVLAATSIRALGRCRPWSGRVSPPTFLRRIGELGLDRRSGGVRAPSAKPALTDIDRQGRWHVEAAPEPHQETGMFRCR